MNDTLYLRPLGLTGSDALKGFFTLAHTGLSFTHVEVIHRRDKTILDRRIAPLDEVIAWADHQGGWIAEQVTFLCMSLTTSRSMISGFSFDVPVIMGILNVTPDSFFDGGRFLDVKEAIRQGETLISSGADILDIGGESTRPGSESVSAEEQCSRILPVIKHFATQGIMVSVDTRNAEVMRYALEAGACILNDVSALTHDPQSIKVAANADCPIILMHMLGTPQTMQCNPTYHDPVLDIFDWLKTRIQACVVAGISSARLIVDPGIGFGKTVTHNVELLRHLSLFHGLGCPILLGVSRKSFIAHLNCGEAPSNRLAGSLAAAILALDQGVSLLRVHDPFETRQAVRIWQHLRHDVRSENGKQRRGN